MMHPVDAKLHADYVAGLEADLAAERARADELWQEVLGQQKLGGAWWGRACAHLVDENKQLAADRDRLRAALDTLMHVVGLTAFKHEGQRAALEEAMQLARAALAEGEAK
jgi:hypothetical protein